MSLLESLRNLIRKYPYFEKLLRRIYLYLEYLINANYQFTHSLNPSISSRSFKDVSKMSSNSKEVFFGYYDKSPWSKNGKYYLLQEIQKDGTLSIKYINLIQNKFNHIGNTETWNYQQGAMLQWVQDPDSDKIIYNTSQENILGSVVHNLQTGKNHFLNWPVQSVHPNMQIAVSINYARLTNVNYEYSYKGTFCNFTSSKNEDEDGIWQFSLKDDKSNLLVSLSELKDFRPRTSTQGSKHCINHVMYSPDGEKMIFIHRWLNKKHIRYSRLFVINNNGTGLNLLLDNDLVSHCCWLDEKHILTYASAPEYGEGYFEINVLDNSVMPFGNELVNKYGDGHPSLSPDGNWILTDTYPNNARIRRLLLWNIEEKKFSNVGEFHSPVSFEDEKRCDLHPRWHPSKPLISIDSAHEGIRKNYVIDVTSITGNFANE